MKTIHLLCLICIAILVLSSCHLGSDTVEPDTSDTVDILSAIETLPLDPDKTELPSYSELCKIQMGMTKGEVVSIIGYPQRKEVRMMPIAPDRSSVCSRLCYIYDSCDGSSILVAFLLKEGDSEEVVANLETVDPSSSDSDNSEFKPPEPYAEYFDWDYQHKPTNESIKSITNGMSIPEVVEIIGKPHRVGPLSGLFSLEWQTEEGYTFRVVCVMPDNPPDDMPDDMDNVEALMKYGVATLVKIYEESTTYSYYDGIYPNSNWLDLNNGDETLEPPSESGAIPNKEAAIALARETFEKLQQEGIGQSYVLKSVFYDTEYDVWIVCFGEEILMPGSCYYIAISKATGEIVKMWPGE